jgi:spore coat polysaccharide biosynthesis predicted glycosyltransferase SpsG
MGSGHVMRCSAIAEELISRGENVFFVGSTSQLSWVDRHISRIGYKAILKGEDDFLPESDTDVLILDSYEIPISNEFIQIANWHRIVLIADEKTPKYNCTLKIHPGLRTDLFEGELVSSLAGPKFIPLRKSLLTNTYDPMNALKPPRILVVAGGSDPYKAVEVISNELSGLEIDFQAKLFLTSRNSLSLDSRFEYYSIGPNMDDVLKSIDLIITTSSTSSLEFLSLGYPVGIVCAVENQEHNYFSLVELGVAAQIGNRTDLNGWVLDKKILRKFVEDQDYRMMLIRKSKGVFDYQGAKRIADAIQSLL